MVWSEEVIIIFVVSSPDCLGSAPYCGQVLIVSHKSLSCYLINSGSHSYVTFLDCSW